MTDGRRHTDSVVVGLASDVGELKGRIKAVEGNVAEIKGDVKTISQDINSLVGQEKTRKWYMRAALILAAAIGGGVGKMS